MEITVRQARSEDAPSMLQVYDRFTQSFVGPVSRTVKHFKSVLRKKDNVNFVAVDGQNQIIGYVHAHLWKRTRAGEFREIVVDPTQDFELVAGRLVERVNAFFMEKRVSSIGAGSVRNPAYERLFPKLGFLEFESTDVFMYGISDVPKFLNEVAPVFANRLKRIENWSGLVQVECEGCSLFLRKVDEDVESIVWTNEPVSLRIFVTREHLVKLMFGVVDSVESHRSGELRLETSESSGKADRLLRVLFPRMQFLVMDYW